MTLYNIFCKNQSVCSWTQRCAKEERYAEIFLPYKFELCKNTYIRGGIEVLVQSLQLLEIETIIIISETRLIIAQTCIEYIHEIIEIMPQKASFEVERGISFCRTRIKFTKSLRFTNCVPSIIC